jgi:hypothetical protein
VLLAVLNLTFDASTLDPTVASWPNLVVGMDWWVDQTPDRFQSNVSGSLNVTAVLVSPASFSHAIDCSLPANTSLSPSPLVSIFNTLCSEAISYTVHSSCDDATAAPPWFSIKSALAGTIDPDRGLPDKVEYAINQSAALASLSQAANVSTLAPLKASHCFVISTHLVQTGATLRQNISVALTLFSSCPPGSSSADGTNVQSCRPCGTGTYQPQPRSTLCFSCPDALPATTTSGATSKSQCTAQPGYLKFGESPIPCPVGATCTGVGTTPETLALQPAYWRTSPGSVNVIKCRHPLYCAGGAFPATGPGRRADGETGALCAPFHMGVLCEACAPGYAKRGDAVLCETCDGANTSADQGRTAGLSLVLILAYVTLVGAVLWSVKRAQSPTQFEKALGALEFTIKLKIIIGLLQVFSGMAVAFPLTLPPFFSSLASLFSVLALDLQVFRLGCTVNGQNHFVELVFSTLVPLGMVLVALVGARSVQFLVKHDVQRVHEINVLQYTLSLAIAFLVFPSVTQKIMRTYQCQTFDDGSVVLTFDPSMPCSGPQYDSMKSYADFMVAVWIVGLPLFILGLLLSERQAINPKSDFQQVINKVRDQDLEIVHLRFLWSPYLPRYFWFEVFEMARKFAQTSLVGFFPPSSISYVFQIVITAASVVVLHALHPFNTRADNVLAIASLWMIIAVSFLAMLVLFNQNPDGTSRGEYDLSALNASLIALFLFAPILALAQVAQVLRQNSLFRTIFYCVNWNRILGSAKPFAAAESSGGVVDASESVPESDNPAFDQGRRPLSQVLLRAKSLHDALPSAVQFELDAKLAQDQVHISELSVLLRLERAKIVALQKELEHVHVALVQGRNDVYVQQQQQRVGPGPGPGTHTSWFSRLSRGYSQGLIQQEQRAMAPGF